MKVLVSWLREFVDIPASADEIARTMSVRGFAVEGIEPVQDVSAGADAVLDFEITANRPDCMSVVGMAREVATACQVAPPRQPEIASLEAVDRADVSVEILNPELCPRYVGAVADVTVGPSPEWLQRRLHAAGIRPISNIVDITNYVMLELGQPMHAFDFARIARGEIRVRTARPGETLTTLDGQTRDLTPDMLMIADAERVIAVGGVMGGANSEVSAATKTIALEAAYFDPPSVRRTSKRLGLKTEASMRFERGADPSLPAVAIQRACALLEKIGAGKARGTMVDRYPSPLQPGSRRLRRERIAGLLGAAVPDADVRRILESLGFEVVDAQDGLTVTVPTRRVDVLREVDLIEEIARHHGFDRLPSTFPALTMAAPALDPRIVRARRLRAILTGRGFSEAVTFGFIAEPAARRFASDGAPVPITNPLSESFAVLRPSLIPGLVEAVARNVRRQVADVRLFEIGSRFNQTSGEQSTLTLAWTGTGRPEHWSEKPRQVDFFDLKGLITQVAQAFDAALQFAPVHRPFFVAGRAATVSARPARSSGSGLQPVHVGVIGQVAPEAAGELGHVTDAPIYVAELDLDQLARFERGEWRVEPLPRFPSVTRDISILVDEGLPAETVRSTVRGSAPATLVDLREFDRYQGRGVPEGKVSLSLRLTFRSPEATLTDGEVQAAMDAIVGALKNAHGAVQR